MKINSYDRLSYIEITFADALSPETIKATGRNDICIKIEVSCNNFCGRNDDIWFAWDEIQVFLSDLKKLEKERKGNAQLACIGSSNKLSEWNMLFYDTNNAGSFAVKFEMQKINYLRHQESILLKISAGFDLDSGDLPNIVSELNSIFNSKHIALE